MENFDKLKILIIGAGISGLSLYQSLKLSKINNQLDIRIIERDEDFDQRSQGYSLTIQQNGQSCLNQLGLLQDLINYKEVCKGRGRRIYDLEGKIIQESKNWKKDQFYFLPRQEVRRILMKNLKEQIEWGKQAQIILNGNQQELKNKVKVKINEEELEIFDLVFACDGIFSKTRNQILQDKLDYLGVIMINGIIQNKNIQIFPEDRSYVQEEQGVARLFVKPFKKGFLMWQITLNMDEEQANDIQNKKENKKYMLFQLIQQKTSNWNGQLIQQIYETEEDELRCGALYTKKSISVEQIDQYFNLGNIIFVGDSAHPMPPFKGQGANQALMDTIEIKNWLEQKQFQKDDIKQIQKDLLQRSQKMKEKSEILVFNSHKLIQN